MNISPGKRLLTFFLAAVLLLSLVPAELLPPAEAVGIDYVSAGNLIRGLPYPMGELTSSLPSSMNGLWIVSSAHQRNDGITGTALILDPNRYEYVTVNDSDGYHYAYGTTGEQLSGNLSTLSDLRLLTKISGSQGSCRFQTNTGKYWNLNDVSGRSYWGDIALSNSSQTFILSAVGDGTYTVRRDTGSLWLYSNGWTYRVSKNDGTEYNASTMTQFRFRFYRVSEEVMGLRDVLQEALVYVVDNSGGRFHKEDYQAYLDLLYQVAGDYTVLHSKGYSQLSAGDRSAIEEDKKKIWDAMAKLKLSDSTLEYMDVPIEVLDFRGDGFLFESSDTWGSPYSLSYAAADINTDRYPGRYEKNTTGSAWSDNFQIAGLVEDTLANGNLVYTAKTVNYIAYHLSQGSFLKTPADKMNRAFYDLVAGGTLTYGEGDYSGTLAKCDPPEPGGELHWNQITTYHDLAYFMLSHMWKSTTDVIGRDTLVSGAQADYSYNLTVPELSRLRLYKNGEIYSYKATSTSTSYDYGYIFNDSTNRPKADPWFRPLTGRGFESPQLYGQYTEGSSYMPEVNYSFTIHAYGAFIYTEDSNLFFEFGGDDDVYFFINGKLVKDIGGVHGLATHKVFLNDYAASLGLTEGQVCHFDMFHAERHTSGINLNLSTNIQLMDESVITEKTQFDPVTDQDLMDGAALNTGAEIGYAFSLTNRRTGPVKNLKFTDSKLGITLDGETGTMTLNGQTDLSQLTLTYSTYDKYSETVYEGTPTVFTDFDSYVCLIRSAVETTGSATPLDSGAYSYAPRSQEELLTLLQLGIPAACKLTIRGFRHTVAAGEFVNSLTTVCTPVQYSPGADGTLTAIESDPVSGAASCRSNGMDLTGVSVPKAYTVVLDYGKPVEIDLEDVASVIQTSSGISLQYVGSTQNGEHGTVRAKAPLNMTFTATGQSLAGETGIFQMTGDRILRYSPTAFLDRAEGFCAVYLVTMADQPSFRAWLMVGVEFLPAAMVYYEAEDFTEEIRLTRKTSQSEEIQRQWDSGENLKKEGNEGGSLQNSTRPGQEIYVPDYTNHPEVLFFGFGNTAEDQARYADSKNGYGGYNFDNAATIKNQWVTYNAKIKDIAADQTAGTLSVTAQAEASGSTEGAYYPDLYLDTVYGGSYFNKPLSYDPQNAEVYQVRFKMKNFRVGDTPYAATRSPFINFQYQTTSQADDSWPSGTEWDTKVATENIHVDVLTIDEYVVMSLPIRDAFRNCGTVNKIRPYFGFIESLSASELGVLTIDYIYIGPWELAPVTTSYGQDTSYYKTDLLSDGESLYVEGNGVRNSGKTEEETEKFTEISFSFTGTGFDLIARTGEQQATYRVTVSREGTAVKTLTVNTKGELELYQIPTVSVQDLDHGTYEVSVMVNDKVDSVIDILDRGNQLYLDALRIYDPIDVSRGADSPGRDAQSAYAAYCADGEAHSVIKEIREILLSAADFQALDDSTPGAVYLDAQNVPKETVPVTDTNGETTGEFETLPDAGESSGGHTTGVVATYEKAGPKNEVYLAPGQMVAFQLVIKSSELPARLDVGAKLINGGTPRLRVVLAKDAGDTLAPVQLPVHTASQQYYSLPLWEERFTAATDAQGNPIRYVYVIVENQGPAGNLSITDMKVAFDTQPTLPEGSTAPAAYENTLSLRKGPTELPVDSFVEFRADRTLSAVVDSYLGTTGGCDHIPGPWVVEVPAAPGKEGSRVSYCDRCGELCGREPVAALKELSFLGATVALGADLSLRYKVDASYFTELGYTDPYVVITDNGTETILRDYRIEDGKYTFVYENISPHKIGDRITATLYGVCGDSLYASESKEYSVEEYCYNMLAKVGKYDSYATLRTLLVDLLLYGAKTQEFTDYRRDALCTARLTPEQLAWRTESCRDLVSCRDDGFETVEAPTVLWEGAGLNLRQSVAIRFKLKAESYRGLEVRITLADKTYVIPGEDLEHREDGTYVHFTSLTAAQMSEPVYATVFRGEEQVSHTFRYSIESYAAAKGEDTVPYLAELVQRMMCYGDSAKAYMG